MEEEPLRQGLHGGGDRVVQVGKEDQVVFPEGAEPRGP